MWIYEKRLQYPVNIQRTDLRMAQLLYAQYGGADSELAAGMRYLMQRFSMPTDSTRAIVNDIGTEELGHWEMIGSMIHQLVRNASYEQIRNSSLAPFYVDHGKGVYPAGANGVPFTYEHLMRMTDDPDVLDPLRFLREREIVHFQRFGEALDIVNGLQVRCRC